jgi:hypothetical protein
MRFMFLLVRGAPWCGKVLDGYDRGMAIRFTSTVLEAPGMKATGIPIPLEVIEELGGSKRPAVSIRVREYTYQTTIGRMGERFMAPLSAEHRTASGLAAGDEIEVTIELDTAPRIVEVPADLAAALDAASARPTFDALAPSRRKAHVTQVESAKSQETRDRRIASVVAELSA